MDEDLQQFIAVKAVFQVVAVIVFLRECEVSTSAIELISCDLDGQIEVAANYHLIENGTGETTCH